MYSLDVGLVDQKMLRTMKKLLCIEYTCIYFMLSTDLRILANNCGSNSGNGNGVFGANNLDPFNDVIPTGNTGQSILLLADDAEYTFTCCGRIDQWEFKVGNAGDVYLQVWRDTGSTWELVGQNYKTGNTVSTITYDVPANEEILVNIGDVIGWYSPGESVITYKGGNNNDDWYSTTSLNSGTTNYAWTSLGTPSDSRDFGIKAFMATPNNPTFTNLDATLALTNAESLLFTITATDADALDVLTYSMTPKGGYSFDPVTATLTSTSTLAVGTHVFDFQVIDTCGNSDTGTLTLTVTNVPPVIHNLPSDIEVQENQLTELHLYDINVTDASGETVTCSISSVSPTSSDFIVKINSGTSTNGIYVKSGPTFNYDTNRQYDLTVSCTDQTTSVTGTFTVFIIPNEPPVIINLAATTHVSTASTTIGDDIFTVTSTDVENDQLYYNMTCIPTGCPFTIYDSGLIESTADLTGHTQIAYDLYVYVYDGYTLVGPRVLTVTLTEQNSVPVISNLPLSSALSLQENIAIGTLVFQTQVTDLNLADNHVYTATYSPAGGSSLFQVDLSTGIVSTTGSIDYEVLSPKTYTITITVNDGQDSDTKSLQVSIIDVNEAPVFASQQYVLTGNEGQAGDVIGTPAYGVTDPDSGNTHSYSIDCIYLNIDSTSGQISLATDYDLDISGTSDTISCSVTVSDGVLTDTATLIVTLQNINDNNPAFTFTTYTFYCDSSDGVSSSLGTAAASDGDLGIYGDLTYSLDQSSFSVDYFGVKTTGEIYIKTDLGYIFNNTNFAFKITATDTGGLEATSNVTIICQAYSTVAVINVTERYITFFEDSRNIPWFVVLMFQLVFIVGVLVFLFIRTGCCDIDCKRVDNYWKRCWRRLRRKRRKYKNRPDPPVIRASHPSPPPPQIPTRVDQSSPQPPTDIWDPWSASANLSK